MRLWLSLAVLMTLVIAVVPAAAQEIEWTDCPFYIFGDEVLGETMECGWLIVPEDRQTSSDAVVELAFAILYSTNPDPPADPIIYLEGGPGGSALAGIDMWYTASLRQNRHIVLIDQRGTGYSYPSLNCHEVDDDENGTELCRERLVSEGIDLNAYNSRENASDIAALIDALGFPEANLYGVSYGTRLALTVMRDHPQKIRSVIIDAVFPPNVAGLNEQAIWANQAFERMFENCAADAACNAAYPDLRQVFYDTVDMMNNSPIEMEDYETGELFDMTGDDLVNQLFQMFYDGSTAAEMPALIVDLSDGSFDYAGEDDTTTAEGGSVADLSDEQYESVVMAYLEMDDVDAFYEYLNGLTEEEYLALEAEAFGYIDDDSEGMFNSVECYEEFPFNSYDEAAALSEGIAPQVANPMLIGIDATLADCDIWGVEQADAFENAAVVSDIPTLVMSGEYDPITPDAWGEVAASTLSNSAHFVFPTIGHGAVETHECPTAIAVAFLDNPLQKPDGSCINAMPGTEFVIE